MDLAHCMAELGLHRVASCRTPVCRNVVVDSKVIGTHLNAAWYHITPCSSIVTHFVPRSHRLSGPYGGIARNQVIARSVLEVHRQIYTE